MRPPSSFNSFSRLATEVRPGLGARPHVADPVLRGAPAFEEGRHLHDRGRLAARREYQNVELGVAADRAEIAGVGGVKVPHRRPAPQHDGVEIALGHLRAHGGPAPVALLQRETGKFKCGAHGLSSYSDVMPGLVPGIHAFLLAKAWMAGTSPAMTLLSSSSSSAPPNNPRCLFPGRTPACSRVRRGRARCRRRRWQGRGSRRS